MKNKNHTFHIVQNRPWPIVVSNSILTIVTAITIWITYKTSNPYLIATRTTTIVAYLWWRDVTREANKQGLHNTNIILGLKIGIIIFITSEVIFFVSFFWTYFHRRISPSIEIGQRWPPIRIKPFNPINVPLLNTIILISSGVSITCSHHRILKNKIWIAKKKY